MTFPSPRPPMLAARCSSTGGTTLPMNAWITLGVTPMKARIAGMVAGVSPVAAQPKTVLSQEQIQVQGPVGGYAKKPESLHKQSKFDGLRGVPPRGRPV